MYTDLNHIQHLLHVWINGARWTKYKFIFECVQNCIKIHSAIKTMHYYWQNINKCTFWLLQKQLYLPIKVCYYYAMLLYSFYFFKHMPYLSIYFRESIKCIRISTKNSLSKWLIKIYPTSEETYKYLQRYCESNFAYLNIKTAY